NVHGFPRPVSISTILQEHHASAVRGHPSPIRLAASVRDYGTPRNQRPHHHRPEASEKAPASRLHNLIPPCLAVSYHCCALVLTAMLIAPSFRKPILRRNMGMPRRTTRESA